MVWPSWLWIGTPLQFSVWLANRLATWTGVVYLWRRLRSRRGFWIWVTVINTASLVSLVLVLWWLHRLAIP